MRTKRLAWAAGALLALALLAAVLFQAVLAALAAAGVPSWVGSAAAIGAVVPPVLALADAYGPLGNRNRTAALREQRAGDLAVDAALAAAVGAVVGFVGAHLLLSPAASGLAELVVLSTATLGGYATFVARNLDAYGGRGPEPDAEEGMRP